MTHHTSTDPLAALLWLLVLVFGAALGLLLYKLIWKDKPVGQQDIDTLREQVSELKAAFAERKTSADQARLADKLKVEQDFAAVASTLGRLVDSAEKLTTITERVGWQGEQLKEVKEQVKEEFKAVHDELKEVKKDIKDLYRDGHART